MNLENYLIDQAGKDWSQLLSDWRELLPASFTLWLVNRFGDIILVQEDESVCLLNIGSGTIRRLTDDRDAFCKLIDIDDNANDFLMVPLVDQCVAANLTLNPGQCYGYKIPPLLGGAYELENSVVVTLAANYSFLAEMWQQTKDLPDGTKVQLVVER